MNKYENKIKLLYREALSVVETQRNIESQASDSDRNYRKIADGLTRNGYRKARNILEQCLELDPNYTPAHKELAVVCRMLDDVESAIYHRRQVKRLTPNDVTNCYNLAKLFHETGRGWEAKTEAEDLATRYPEDKAIRRLLDHISLNRVNRIPRIFPIYTALLMPVFGMIGVIQPYPVENLMTLSFYTVFGTIFTILGFFANFILSRLLTQVPGEAKIELSDGFWSIEDIGYAADVIQNLGLGALFFVAGSWVKQVWGIFELVGVVLFISIELISLRRYLLRRKHLMSPVVCTAMWVFVMGLSWFFGLSGAWLTLVNFGYQEVIIAQFIVGAIGGISQWMVLQVKFRQSGWWIIATAVGWGGGWLLIELTFAPLDSAQVFSQSVSETVAMMRNLPPIWIFALVGMLIGFGQWLILRKHITNAEWWIPVTAVAWAIGALVGQAQSQAITTPYNLGVSELFGWPLSGVVVGGITGFILFHMFQTAEYSEPNVS